MNNPYSSTDEALLTSLKDHPFTKDLDADHLASLTRCARPCKTQQGIYLWRQGQHADGLLLIQSGQVDLEIGIPLQGPLRIETIGEGEVLGWSWLLPPYRWHFDARAITAVQGIYLEGPCLRQTCESDPALGYQVLRTLTPLIAKRLETARLRLLELYEPGIRR